MDKKFLLIVLSLMISVVSYSQLCEASVYAVEDTIACNDSTLIIFGSSGGSEEFNCPQPNGSTGPCDPAWSVNPGVDFSQPYIPSPDGNGYLWMGNTISGASPPGGNNTPRIVVSPLYDATCGGQICFDFVYASQGGTSPTEGPDEYDEGISLQYSIGGAWVDMQYWAPNGTVLVSNPGVSSPGVGANGPFTTWQDDVCVAIPIAAQVPNVNFRFAQLPTNGDSGFGYDHWGIDDISVSINSSVATITMISPDTMFIGTTPDTFKVGPIADSTLYEFIIDYGTSQELDSVMVYTEPTNVGPDLILDCNNNIVQLQATGIAPIGVYTWSPSTFLSNPNIINPTASPIDTTEYIFTSSCGSDTVMVNVIANYSFSTSGDTSICVGDTAYLETYGGALSYVWTSSTGDQSSISDTTIANPAFFPTTTTTYTITTDSAGCIKTNDITVWVSNKQIPLLFLTGAGCSGANNGGTIAIGIGGLGDIEYILNDGVNLPDTQNTGSFNGLAPGNYVMTISDSMNCPIDSNIVITGGISVNIDSVYAVNPLCVGDTGGLFEVYLDTNVAATYSINGGPGQSSNIFTGLSDGLYSISAQFGSCPASTVDTSLSAPATVDITFIDSTDLSCFGAGDGEIVVSASQGVTPYTYSSDNSTFQTDSFFNNLDAGSYTIYAQDANGCKDSLITSISEPLPSAITNIVINDATCFGDSGSISFDVINGTPPYQYSIDGGANYFSSNSFTNVAPGAYNLIGMDTNTCLSVTVNDTVFEPAQIVLIADSVNSSTCGASDGEIHMSASGGQGALTFNIDAGAFGSSGSFTGLAAGTYAMGVMDANNCTVYMNVLVSNTGGATLSIASYDSVQCFGMNTASVQLSASGGTAPYQFNVDAGANQPDSLFNNLSGGLHNFVVEDATGCQGNVSITIFEPAVLDLTASQDSVSCFGGNDGEIILVASGGTSPYVYALNDTSTVQLDTNFNMLSVGSNMAYVIDTNGCIDSVAQDVYQADSLEIINVMTDSVSCFGGTDGQITFNGMGGTPAYLYSTNGGTSFGSLNTYSVDTGTYDLMIEDANGCQSVVNTVTIYEPTDLELDSTNSVMTTCNLNNGSLEVTASGGVGPYSYTLNDTTTNTTGLFSNVSAMTHTVVVTDANLCTETINITVDAVSSVSLSLDSFTNVSCGGANDATVSLIASGGTPPYSIELIGGVTQPSTYFTGLSGGANVFVISDATATCTDTVTVNIFEPNTLTLSSSQDSMSCHSYSDGQITLVASGGGSTYTYSISNSPSSQGLPVFTNLSSGAYTMTVEDENGCTASVMQQVYQPDTLIITSVNPQDITCSSDGQFTIDATGGTGPYTYSISGGASNQTSNQFDVSTAGTYTLSVNDANGCPTATAIDSVEAPTPVTYVIDSATGTLLCNNSFNGFIGIVASGGTGPYTYSINNGAFQVDTFFNGLAPGTYTVNVQDAFNCLSTPSSVTITQPSGIAETTTGNGISCNGLSDGSIVINSITGGTPPYTVIVNNDTMIYSANMVFNNLPAGTYTGTIIDGNSCALAFTENVADVTALSLSLQSPQHVSCYGADDGEVYVTVTGGTPLYNYIINVGSFVDSVTSDGSVNFINLAGIETGLTYNISITDANGCSTSITETITQPSQLIIDSIIVDSISCFGAGDGELAVSASGGSTPYTYLWSPNNETGDIITGLNPGVYTVSVTDANNCTISSSQTIQSVDPILATINPDTADINMGDTVQLGVTVQNAIGTNLQYSWTPTIGLSCTDCQNPVVNMNNDIAYSVVVTDENGCQSYNFTQSFILVDGSLFYFIPNGFTPNGDGLNDNFQVFGDDIQSVGMKVFNRWGEKIFEGDRQSKHWDGNYKGISQSSGVYSYVVKIKFLNDVEIVKKGSVTLIR